VQLTGMGNLTWPLISNPAQSANIIEFSNKGGNDIPGHRLLFHCGPHAELTDFIGYNKDTNNWAKMTPAYSSTLSHAWDSQTYDPVTGDFYVYVKTTGNFRRLPSGSTTWQSIASIPALSQTESVSLCWDEARNGLICWNRETGCAFWAKNAGTGSWAQLGDPGIQGSLGMASHYMRVTQELFLADGAANPTKYWLLNQAGTFAGPFTAPMTIFASEGSSNMTQYDWASQRLLVVDKVTNEFRTFNPNTRQWRLVTPSNGALPINGNPAAGDAWSISLEDIGCVFFFVCRSNFIAPSAYLYRHTSAPIVPATVTFNAPGSHDMTQYVENWNSSTMLLELQGTTLPSGFSFDGTTGALTCSASSGSVSGLELIVIPI